MGQSIESPLSETVERRFLPYIQRFDQRVFGRSSVATNPIADLPPTLAAATA